VGARDALVRRYSTEPPYDRCTVVLRHVPTETTVYVASDMPDEAFQKLHELELRPGATYVWDENRGEWDTTGERPHAPEVSSLSERVRRLFRRGAGGVA
jgi:hypothetical protein